ncbi:hypothetical protein RA276_28150, partial [Pseudomonas syringae pv. tagetis]|uniref:hypothetical protein n=1 Tax=Pseudomonas syringae group genomosp. 7 TaxID=251699 RepID=UPI0037705F0E
FTGTDGKGSSVHARGRFVGAGRGGRANRRRGGGFFVGVVGVVWWGWFCGFCWFCLVVVGCVGFGVVCCGFLVVFGFLGGWCGLVGCLWCLWFLL